MPTDTRPSTAEVWDWLAHVPDPEIPVISLTDLGIIRDVAWDEETLVVTVTPTYSGCPATAIINLDIEKALHDRGVGKVRLKRQISPPWTTDWISEAGKAKLAAYGIAPPDLANTATCPQCGSTDTEEVSRFGSTPCKAQWRCRQCLEPFDRFKCH